MIKQILTHHKKTYTIKSYKEYINNKLILYEKYDINGNKTYKKTNEKWVKWLYDENNNNTYYETSNGIIWYVTYNQNYQVLFSAGNEGTYREFRYNEKNKLIYAERGNSITKTKPKIDVY